MVTVSDILTYQGSDKDVTINYAMLVVTTIPVMMLMVSVRGESAALLRYGALPLLLLGLFAFQILLCLGVGCVGISIVWSALGGFQCVAEPALSSSRASSGSMSPRLLRTGTCGSLVLCGAAWCYYAITLDAITTIAHVSAAVLGTILAAVFVRLARRCIDKNEERRLLRKLSPPEGAAV